LDNEKKVKQDKNVKDKYFEALSEMVVLEDFSFDNLWDTFFNENISANLLKLFLKFKAMNRRGKRFVVTPDNHHAIPRGLLL